MKKRCIITLIFLLLIPSVAFAQTSRSRSGAATANRSWAGFITAFRAAVQKRDRAALSRMIAIPFVTQVDGELDSAAKVFKWLDQDNGWNELQKEVRPGAKFTDLGGPTHNRCAKNGVFCFSFGPDGLWRLSMQGENE